MDINELTMYNNTDMFEIDDDTVECDYTFEDICSSFDSLELQFVENDTEQTVKNLFRYFKKRMVPMDLEGCQTLAEEYVKASKLDGSCAEQ